MLLLVGKGGGVLPEWSINLKNIFRTPNLLQQGFLVMAWALLYASSRGLLGLVQMLQYDFSDGMHCFYVIRFCMYRQSIKITCWINQYKSIMRWTIVYPHFAKAYCSSTCTWHSFMFPKKIEILCKLYGEFWVGFFVKKVFFCRLLTPKVKHEILKTYNTSTNFLQWYSKS